ncbi:Glucose/arabinose dehydrogenase, beta-propeller fold [Tranquillimonas rosea]|uniref:Glucose/arabinose dehydrogenase, beta-propeller fold n=1 Tax=Tranquillimonas rosea TaxID=641238 RepID=A0A1H9PW91_9RHOB|nr:PQQ-dependent sugar dehydrogenase [Tranquillimonas rosea]SER52039.1 Glucose/arabinose dehydrogenase, beta-propeller fold [Tranquillimonas rosea]
MPRATAISTIALVTALPGLALAQETHQWGAKNVPDFEPAFENQTRAPLTPSDYEIQSTEVAGGLVHPWAIEMLPGDGGYLVTERSGNLRQIGEDGTLSDPISGVPEVFNQGQGGLLDVKAGPSFEDDRMIYLTYSKPMGDGMSATAAARGVLSEDMTQLSEVEDIFVQDPPSPTAKHYGSRVVFDGDGHVFVTMGEHSSMDERVYSQDLDKTYGKVARLNLDGSVPDDNPFLDDDAAIDSIYSYGHRNVQGAAIRPSTGNLWTIEHGPAGGDELNLIEPGANYGWPVVSYGEQYSGNPIGSGEAAHEPEGFVEPRYYWDPVIAPGDMTFYEGGMFSDWEGDILIGGLVSGGLVRVALDDSTATEEERIMPQLGRVRDVEVDEDGSLLVATDFPDGAVIRLTTGSGTN